MDKGLDVLVLEQDLRMYRRIFGWTFSLIGFGVLLAVFSFWYFVEDGRSSFLSGDHSSFTFLCSVFLGLLSAILALGVLRSFGSGDRARILCGHVIGLCSFFVGILLCMNIYLCMYENGSLQYLVFSLAWFVFIALLYELSGHSSST